jgi:RHS repeat-associated protein
MALRPISLSVAATIAIGIANVEDVKANYALVRSIPSPNAGPDLFGYRLAPHADGASVVISAPFAPDGSGAAYVFDVTTGALTQTILNPFPAGFDVFSFSSAVVGSKLAFGAMYDDSPGATDAGAVYTFDASSGNLLQTFAEPQPSVADTKFGWATSSIGNDLLVGTNEGGVAYRIDGTTGIPAVTYADPTPITGERGFGQAIAEGAGLVYVAHPEDIQDPITSVYVGSVYVFDAASGTLQRTLQAPVSEFNMFGAALLVSGTTVAVGAPGADGGLGVVYEFDGSTGTLLQTIHNPDPYGPNGFGWAMSLLGDDYVIAASGDESTPGSVYVVDGSTGAVIDTIPNPTLDGGIFGISVAVLDGTIIIGGLSPDQSVGSVYVYSECGDGTLNPGEECDDGNSNGGDGCSPDCTIEGGGSTTTTTSTSSTSTTLPAFACGDNVHGQGEVCDGTDLAGETCVSLGFAGGTGLLCLPGCRGFNSEACVLPTTPPTLTPPTLNRTVVTTTGAATEFLHQGPNRVQLGVGDGTIEAVRAAVVRGIALDRMGAPIPLVAVRVLDHPEFGRSLSRADGAFDIAVNGGGRLTLRFEKTGYLPVDRALDVPWQDYIPGLEVRLTPFDQANAVDLSQPGMKVARGSVQNDADGTRQATLLFPEGVTANLVLPGGATQPITAMTVRATEYTVGADGFEAMPADLPPTSAYTYAVELSVDEAIAAGATSVQFSQPVPFYVENFLDFGGGVRFPVGETVPTGYYDRVAGEWVPSTSGRIVEIVSESSGLANLDVDGDGDSDAADSTAYGTLGIMTEERTTLASLYEPGAELWRVPIPHFSPVDCNWPFGPPPDAGSPGGSPPRGDGPPDPSPTCGSVIGVENQSLGESVPIVGTPYRLHYQSDRVPGRTAARSLTIELSTATLPASVIGIELDVRIAGQQSVSTFPVQANLSHTFTWDGLDAYGRPTQGSQKAVVRVGYTYQGVYERTTTFGAVGRGNVITGSLTRRTLTFWQEHKVNVLLPRWDNQALELGNWSLSVHHVFDPVSRTLFRGDGTQQAATDVSHVIGMFAGTGTAGGSGDGGPAVDARLNAPQDVAVAADGTAYIADTGNHRIRRVTTDGAIQTFAGTGVTGGTALCGGCPTCNPEQCPAGSATFSSPNAILVAPDGSVYVDDAGHFRIRRIGVDGIVSTVAGTQTQGSGGAGDGQLATHSSVRFFAPEAMALGPDGSLYIADRGDGRIRRVDPAGIISTFAGGGTSTAENISATTARLFSPSGVTVAPDGTVVVADGGLSRKVRRISTQGLIRTVAGTGSAGDTGDGGPATAATFTGLSRVSAAADGSIYVTDITRERVRLLTTDGDIVAFACDTAATGAGNDGPARAANCVTPRGIGVAPDGSTYVVESSRHQVRRVSGTFPSGIATSVMLASPDASEVYQFDHAGRHLRTLDALTAATKTEFSYDPGGRLVGVADVAGNLTSINRTANGTASSISAPGGQLTTLSVVDGELRSIVNPAAEAYQFSYEAGGLLETLTTPRGYLASFEYDALGRLEQDGDAAGGAKALDRIVDASEAIEVSLDTRATATSSYGSTYRLETSPNGEREWTTTEVGTGLATILESTSSGALTAEYPDGTVVEQTDGPDPRFGMQAPLPTTYVLQTPGGHVLTRNETRVRSPLSDPNDPFSYQSLTTSVTLNGDAPRVTHYDRAANTITETSPEGRISVATLDTLGRVIELQIGNLAPVSFTYGTAGSSNGKTVTGTRSDGVTTRQYALEYDAGRRLSRITDPRGQETEISRDDADRATAAALPGNRQVEFGYDADGNTTMVAPPDRPEHEFVFTPVNLLETYTPPFASGTGTLSTGYTYRLDRQRLEVLRPSGDTVAFGYDAAGRLDGVTTSTHETELAYDATTGHLSSTTSTNLATDEAVALALTFDGRLPIEETWSGPIGGSVTRVYNHHLQVESLLVNGTSAAANHYDEDGLLTQAGALTLTPDANHGLLRDTTLGVVSDTRTYNSFGELETYSATVSGLSQLTYALERDEPLGRISRKTETIQGVTTVYDYEYDDAGRLNRVYENSTLASEYTYDANGNRLTAPGLSSPPTYDDQDRLLAYGGLAFTYTANGELLSRTVGASTTSYTYDAVGNLRAVELPNGDEIEYLIDGRNRRVGKRVNGVVEYGLLYDDQLRPVARLDASGEIVARYVYGTRINVPEYMDAGGHTYRIISDHLGSPRLVVNTATGGIVQQMDYDEFGRVVANTNPGFQPFGFAGGVYDTDTGLVRFGARDYDPGIGRWTAPDPMRFEAADSNLYAYAFSDPVNLTDPTGEVLPAVVVYWTAWGLLVAFPAVSIGPLLFPDDLTRLPRGSPPGTTRPGFPGPPFPPLLRPRPPVACGR